MLLFQFHCKQPAKTQQDIKLYKILNDTITS